MEARSNIRNTVRRQPRLLTTTSIASLLDSATISLGFFVGVSSDCDIRRFGFSSSNGVPGVGSCDVWKCRLSRTLVASEKISQRGTSELSSISEELFERGKLGKRWWQSDRVLSYIIASRYYITCYATNHFSD